MQLLFATHNTNKAKEINDIIGPSFQVLTLSDIGYNKAIIENGDSFAANAMIKAKAGFNHSGMACFADDSGLKVSALNGAPGIYSARYAGKPKNDQKNIELLLRNMLDISDRRACFVTVICFKNAQGIYTFEGICNGHIAHEPRGNSGFGYDPVFIPDGYQQTFAEMEPALKNQISHRAIALQKFIRFLQTNY